MAPLRVLLIDDEEELVSTLVERLMLRGIEVEGVTSGADAFVRVQEKKFDVVVLDMKMPGMGGLEVMRSIRREQPGIKFVLMTGRGSLEEGEEGNTGGSLRLSLEAHQHRGSDRENDGGGTCLKRSFYGKKAWPSLGVLRQVFLTRSTMSWPLSLNLPV